MTEIDSEHGARHRHGARLIQRAVGAVVLWAAIAASCLAGAAVAAAEPVSDRPTVQDATITTPYDPDVLGRIYLNVLANGAVIPAGGTLTFATDACVPSVQHTVTVGSDGTVTVNPRVPIDLTCSFHGTDVNGTQSNEASLHVVVPSPGLPQIHDQSRDFVIGEGGRSLLILQGLLAAGATDPVGRGLTFTASGCTPSPQTQVAIQPDGTVSVNVLQPIDLTCTVRAKDAAEQLSNVASLHIRVHAAPLPTVQDQTVSQVAETNQVWDGVLSRGATNPAGGNLVYTLGLAPVGSPTGCRYNGGADLGLVSQPTPGVDHLLVDLAGSGFSGSIICGYAAQDVRSIPVFATLTITVPAVFPTSTTLTPTSAIGSVDQPIDLEASVAGSTESSPAGDTTPTGTVTFLVDGAPFGQPVGLDPSGRASIRIIAGSGIHSIVARYSGDAQHQSSSSAPSSVGIRCDMVISGQRFAPVLARRGTVCLVNAAITGTLVIPAGITLDVENSVIAGPLLVARAAGVRVCGSRFANLAVVASTGFAVVGDPAHRCSANTVTGALLAISNAHGLVIVDNQVGGMLQAAGNSGAGPLSDETSPVISGNHR